MQSFKLLIINKLWVLLNPLDYNKRRNAMKNRLCNGFLFLLSKLLIVGVFTSSSSADSL
jgi:hypothetical protein